MSQIIATAEQAAVLSEAVDAVKVVSEDGRLLGSVLPPFTSAEVAEARRVAASGQQRRLFSQVIDRLRAAEGSK